MPLNKTLDNLRSRVASFVGPSDEIKWSVDTSPSPSELVVEDTVNSTELYRLPLNTQLETTLESGGKNAISSGALTNQNPTNHATEHHDGGVDEIDAADLAGGSGSSGQVLETDGSAASWSTPGGLGTSDFADESGTFSVQNDTKATSTVSFTNTYVPETASIVTGATIADTADDQRHVTTAVKTLNTDSNGNLTGCDIEYTTGLSDGTVYWRVNGVPV